MKRNLQFLTTLLFAFTLQNTSAQWTQVGQNINGQNSVDNFGFAVSMSADGLTVASSSPYSSHPGSAVGHVQVYKNIGGVWTQEGQDLIGENQGDSFGASISLSNDGTILALSAPNHDLPLSNIGYVRVYENISGTWTQIGQNIVGSSAGDQSGQSVSLSGDGLSVAIGTPKHSGVLGQVRVYKNVGGSWVQQGSDIDGIAGQDALGHSVCMSNDGLTLIAGARGSSLGVDTFEGSAKVYSFNGTDWVQKGATINGEAIYDNAGAAVGISGDGTTIAVGANNNDGTGSNAGHVRLYQFSTGAWAQIGQDIDGEATNDQSGISLSLSDDGSIVVIGAKGNSGGGSVAGQARVYENIGGSWVQKGLDIDGIAYDQSGWSVDISSDGSKVVVGAPYNSEIAQYNGQAKVYNFPSSVDVESNDTSLELKIFPNPSFGQLYFETTNIEEKLKNIELINSQGQIVERITTANNYIDISHLTKGVYFLQIQIGDTITTKKMIKE